MSLRLKTILGVALIEAVLLVFLITMTLNYLRSTNYDGLQKRAITTAQLFATTTQQAVLAFDLASLEAFVQELLKNPDLVYVRILDQQGRVFAQGGDEVRLARPFVADDAVEQVHDSVYDISAEIVHQGTLYGRVELGIDITYLTAEIEDATRWSQLIALIEMLLVALFSFLLGTYLTRQLAIVGQSAKAIAYGNLDVDIPVVSRDEVGKLASAFNLMTKNLREVSDRRNLAEAELRRLNASLEERVRARTRELQDKNRDLENANNALLDAQGKLVQSEKMASLGVLAAGVAHEINNPVGFVKSNISTMQEYLVDYHRVLDAAEQVFAADEAQRQDALHNYENLLRRIDFDFVKADSEGLIRESVRGLERVSEIVKDLKEFARTDQNSSFVAVDLNEAVRSAMSIANNQLKYHCEVEADLEDDLPETFAQLGKISQVVLNLLLNAGHACEKNGQIHVRSYVDNDSIVIEVKDNGPGVPKEIQERIFDPFFTTKPVGTGTGLGLSISFSIMQEHQGRIKLDSVEGEGACFQLVLPILRSAPN